MENIHSNPAELAAKEALDRVFNCISQKANFVLEAGAGAGKTYSLIHALNYLIKTRGTELIRKDQKIACITYTNVARNEIDSRTDRHPAIFSATVHAFCWNLIKDFQPKLRSLVPQLKKWQERINDAGGITNQTIVYELGYPKVEEHQIMLSHSDVLSLTIFLMEEIKFRKVFTQRFPVLFIDEYQDTETGFIESLKRNFLENNDGPLLGFFGDHWQKIYGSGCGKIEHPNLQNIGKRANFRSSKRIVDSLNRARSELTQEISSSSDGSVLVYHTNEWSGERRIEAHWKDDLPSNIAHQFLEKTKNVLLNLEWDFSPEKTKILMLTHNVLAHEQGYGNLADAFDNNDSFIKKEDEYIAFFSNILEPVCTAFENQKYGQMFSILGGNVPLIRSHKDKAEWVTNMNTLLTLRKTGTVGMVIDNLQKNKLPRFPDKIEKKNKKFEFLTTTEELTDIERSSFERVKKLREVPYQEVIALTKFINEMTPFATKHSVKGAEFDNVLVVLGRGWNQYNFSQMLEWMKVGVPVNKQESFERNRNLFYVACSRPKQNLALLFTQKLSANALETLSNCFGEDSIHSLE